MKIGYDTTDRRGNASFSGRYFLFEKLGPSHDWMGGRARISGKARLQGTKKMGDREGEKDPTWGNRNLQDK